MSKTKKIIVMSSLVLLLAVTAVLNVVLVRNKTANGDTVAVSNYFFTTYRSERTTTRSEELVQLDSVIALYDQDSEKYTEAVNLKMKIVEIMEKELALETMIKSKGFSDAVVSIGVDSDNVNVFVNSNELDMNTALSIYKCLIDEASVDPLNIIIMPVYSQV